MSINKNNQPAIPNVPTNVTPEMRNFLEALRTSVQTFQGGRNPNAVDDRAVTFKDLKNGNVTLNQTNVINALTGESLKESSSSSSGKAKTPKKIPNLFKAPVDQPEQPQSFAVDVGLTNVVMTWAQVKYRGHGYTEIFRQRTELRDDGTPVDPPRFDADAHSYAHTVGTVFSDKVEPKTGYYYWIRHVNTKGEAGPLSSDEGVFIKVDASIRDQLAKEHLTGVVNVSEIPTTNIGSNVILYTPTNTLMHWDGSKYSVQLPENAIVAGSIRSEHIAAGAIIAEKMSVEKLSALSTNLGDINGGSININNRFIVRTDGTAEMRSSEQNIGLVIDSEQILVYDENGVIRVRIGKLRDD